LDRTSKFTHAELHKKARPWAAKPLFDIGNQLAELAKNRLGATAL
jgi:hypothetical protein